MEFRRGAGSSLEVLYGKVSLTPTLLHTVGTSTVLPAPTTFDLINGVAIATNVAPSPAPVGGQVEWAYTFKITDNFGKTWEYMVGVPDGTTEINFNVLPRYFATKPPLFGAGPQGVPGEAATIEIGSVGATPPGSAPTVTNSGTANDAVLNFELPRGEVGPQGVGVPDGGTALQIIRKDAANVTTEWATVDKALVGLGNVDNTSDANKPVSVAQQGAIDALEGRTDANVSSLLGDSSSSSRETLDNILDESVPPLVELGQAVPSDPTAYIDNIRVLTVFPMHDPDTTRAFIQGVTINAEDNELYVNTGGGAYGFQRIEVRDLTTGIRKSYRTLTAAQLSYTEGMPWWKNALGELLFIVRLGPSAASPSTYQIYNYTTDTLSLAITINGRVKGDVVGNVYVTTDAYGTSASVFWLYDWESVKSGAPILVGTYPISNPGQTFAKVQGIATTGSNYFIVGGDQSESPTVTAYDWTGQLLFARRWERPAFAAAVNAERPGTITKTDYEWESEGSTNLDGRLVTVHVVGNGTSDAQGYIRTAIVVQHGVQSGTRMLATPVPSYTRDTGWVDATYITPYTYAHINRRLQYRVRDGVVYWRGSVRAETGNIPLGSYVQVAEAPPTTATPSLPLRTEIGDTVAQGFAAFERNQPVKVYLRVTSTEVSFSPAPFLNS